MYLDNSDCLFESAFQIMNIHRDLLIYNDFYDRTNCICEQRMSIQVLLKNVSSEPLLYAFKLFGVIQFLHLLAMARNQHGRPG